MPILSMFYGIVVYMYAYDNQKHHAPHFHEIGRASWWAIVYISVVAG